MFLLWKKGHNGKEYAKKDIINKENWWCVQTENKTFVDKLTNKLMEKIIKMLTAEITTTSRTTMFTAAEFAMFTRFETKHNSFKKRMN